MDNQSSPLNELEHAIMTILDGVNEAIMNGNVRIMTTDSVSHVHSNISRCSICEYNESKRSA